MIPMILVGIVASIMVLQSFLGPGAQRAGAKFGTLIGIVIGFIVGLILNLIVTPIITGIFVSSAERKKNNELSKSLFDSLSNDIKSLVI